MAPPRFSPNDQQNEIAAAFSENCDLLGAPKTMRALLNAAGTRFGEPRIGELVAHVAARQAEFGEAVISDFRHGRFSAATSLVRSMLETTVWISWALGRPDDEEQKRRLIRLLLVGYRDARSKGQEIPPDAHRLLANVTGKAARKPPSFENVLEQLDALEAKTEGGKPFWVSHAAHYDFASDYTHPETFAPAVRDIDDPKPIEALGVAALTWGHQYLALAGSACAILADLAELKDQIERRYGAVADVQRAERQRVFGN
jgi:hypothetical protein